MAPFATSVLTKNLINVSQDAISSPRRSESSSPRETVHVSEIVDRVEDSYPSAYQGGHVQRQRSDDNFENLYSVSPKSKSKTHGGLIRSKTTSRPVAATSRTSSYVSGAAHNSVHNSVDAAQRNTGAAVRSAMEALIEDGATEQPRRERSRLSEIQSDNSATVRPQDHHVQLDATASTGALAMLTPAHDSGKVQPSAKRTKHTKPSIAVRPSNGLPTPAITSKRLSAAAPNTGQSAFEALRARRSGYSPTVTPIAMTDVEGRTEDRKTIKTAPPRESTIPATEPMNKGATAKLQPRKDETRPSLGEVPASAGASKPDKSVYDFEPDDGTIVTGSEQSKKHAAPKDDATRSTRAPPRVQPRRGAKPDASYKMAEFDDSDESEADVPHAKRSRPPRATAVKDVGRSAIRGKKSTASGSIKGSTPGTLRRVRKQAARPLSSKTYAQAKSTTKPNTAKNRMKPLNPNEGINSITKPPEVSKKTMPSATASIIGVACPGDNTIPIHDQETLEDFGSKIVQYDVVNDIDVEGLKSATNARHMKAGKKSTRRPSSAISREDDSVPLAVRDSKQAKNSHGDSQDNAIVLSERESESPEVPESYQEAPLQQPETRSRHERRMIPKTPVNMQSNPPPQSSCADVASRPRLVNAEVTKKSNLISFDKSGPRNQGSISVRKEDSKASRTRRNAVAPSAEPSRSALHNPSKDKRTIPGASSSSASELRQLQVAEAAPLVNVAGNVPDALTSFSKAQSLKVTERSDTPRPGRESLARHATLEAFPLVEDDGFVVMDEPKTAALPQYTRRSPHKFKRQPVAARTDSRKAMPPPAVQSKDTFAPALSGSLQPLTTSTSMINSVSSESGSLLEQPKTVTIATKRVRQSPALDARAPKRVRVAEDPSLGVYEPVIACKTKLVVGQPSQQKPRKPSRNVSHGSQSVDIHGSPIPDGMVVDGQSTVLEMFSQQAAASPNDAMMETVPPVNPQISRITKDAPSRPPPSVPRADLASNAKPRPAPPEEQSKAITAHARTVNGQLQVEDRSLPSSADPFTSSEGSQYALPRTLTSRFMKSLRQMVDKHERDTGQQHDEEDPEKTLVATPPTHTPAERAHSPSPPVSSSASPRDEGPSQPMRDIGIWRKGLLHHQADFFDELVIISHMIVRELVDAETAATNEADDFRRRGLQVVRDLEQEQILQYQESLSNVQAKKEKLQKQFGNCMQQVSERWGYVSAAQKQREKNDNGTAVAIKGLRSLIAEVC